MHVTIKVYALFLSILSDNSNNKNKYFLGYYTKIEDGSKK